MSVVLFGAVLLSLADLPERLGLSPKREQFVNTIFSCYDLWGGVMFCEDLFCPVMYRNAMLCVVALCPVKIGNVGCCSVIFPSQVCLGRFDSDDGTISRVK